MPACTRALVTTSLTASWALSRRSAPSSCSRKLAHPAPAREQHCAALAGSDWGQLDRSQRHDAPWEVCAETTPFARLARAGAGLLPRLPVMDIRSLTRVEAEERAALIEVAALRHRRRPDGPARRARLPGRVDGPFSCRRPGATTFVDCAVEVVSATLNGDRSTRPQRRPDPADRPGRRQRPGRRVGAVRDLATGEWVHRSVDPSDKEVYVWTSFEPDDARRAWACFDQPDLKAPHGFTVLAPAAWMVVSNSGDPVVAQHDGDAQALGVPGHAAAVDVRPGGQRRAVPRDPLRARRASTSACWRGGRSRASSTATPTSCSRSPARGSRSSATGSGSRSRSTSTTRSSCPTWAAPWRTTAA